MEEQLLWKWTTEGNTPSHSTFKTASMDRQGECMATSEGNSKTRVYA